MTCLEKLLEASIENVGDRVVVVCSSVKALNLIESICNLREWKSVRIDGSTSSDQRQDIVTSFNLYNSAKVFVLSLESQQYISFTVNHLSLKLAKGNCLFMLLESGSFTTSHSSGRHVTKA